MGELLLPSEGKGGVKAFLHFLTALVLLLLLIRPFFSFLQAGELPLQGELPFADEEALTADYEQILSDAVASRSAVQLRDGITSLLMQEFDLAEQELQVSVKLAETGEPEQITVVLTGVGLLQDPREIETYLEKRFSCKVEVR